MVTVITLMVLIAICAVIVTPSVLLGNYITSKILKKKSDE